MSPRAERRLSSVNQGFRPSVERRASSAKAISLSADNSQPLDMSIFRVTVRTMRFLFWFMPGVSIFTVLFNYHFCRLSIPRRRLIGLGEAIVEDIPMALLSIAYIVLAVNLKNGEKTVWELVWGELFFALLSLSITIVKTASSFLYRLVALSKEDVADVGEMQAFHAVGAIMTFFLTHWLFWVSGVYLFAFIYTSTTGDEIAFEL